MPAFCVAPSDARIQIASASGECPFACVTLLVTETIACSSASASFQARAEGCGGRVGGGLDIAGLVAVEQQPEAVAGIL